MSESDRGSLGIVGGVSFIILALFLLVIPGAIFNNLQLSGLTPATPTGPGDWNCPTSLTADASFWPVCQPKVSAGCQANPGECGFNQTTLNFLNPYSPFTAIFQGNIAAFLSDLSYQGPTTLPFATLQGPIVYGNISVNFGTECTLITTACTYHITQADANQIVLAKSAFKGSGATGYNNTDTLGYKVNFYNWNVTDFSQPQLLDHNNYGGLCIPFSPSSTSAFRYFTCQYKDYHGGWNYWMNGWNATFTVPADLPKVAIYSHFLNFNSTTCVNISASDKAYAYSPNCASIIQSLNSLPQSSLSGLGYIVGFIGAIILLLIGLGLGVGGGGLTFNFNLQTNSQGTRLAQALGLTLLIWIPLYSEFSGWIGVLPFGLDLVVAFVLVGTAFFGMFNLTLQPAAA